MLRNGSDLIKKGDVILILGILMLGIAGFVLSGFYHPKGDVVRVTIEGSEYGIWPLDEDRNIPIRESGFRNNLEIRGGEVRMTEADCPDRICVKHKPIRYNGESIICLPHKLVVTVEASGGEDTQSVEDASGEEDTQSVEDASGEEDTQSAGDASGEEDTQSAEDASGEEGTPFTVDAISR